MSFSLQLRALFTKKFTLIIFAILIGVTLAQALRLNQYMQIYEVEGTIVDFVLFTVGGWESPTLFTFILTWFCLSIIFLYVSVRSKVVLEDYNGFLITRFKCRTDVWLSNCITQLILSVVLFSIYFSIVIIIGILGFTISFDASAYTLEFYPNLMQYMGADLPKICVIVFIIFISGLYAIFTLGHVVLLVCENALKSVMCIAGIMLIGTILTVYAGLPRILSLLLYISTASLNGSIESIAIALLINVGLGFLFSIIGGMYIRKCDIR